MLSLLLAAMMSGLMGCATLQLPFGKKMQKATVADPCTQILCLWAPGDGHDPNSRPCKGFQGQILFLSTRRATPVQIEGEITIYLFDDQGTVEEQSKPIHKYVFDNGSWAIHLADTTFGPTYSVFVPYPKHGVKDANCTLRVRLKPKQGPTVYSEFMNMQLGSKAKTVRGDEAKPTTAEEIEQSTTDALSDMLRRTTTIATSPKSESVQTVSAEVPESELNKVQFASHEVVSESTKSSPEADRIRQLELMVQRLTELQNSRSLDLSVLSDDRPSEPARLAENQADRSNQPSERLKLGRQRKSRGDSESIERRSITRRQPHPLDDDSPEPSHRVNDADLAREPVIGDPFDSQPVRISRE